MTTGSLPEELERVLRTHSKTTEAICDSFTEKLAATPAPAIIYHYTDDRGLKGILETGRLWFTDLFNLNDPSELNHGIRHALNILGQEAKKGLPEATFFYKKFSHALTGNVENSAHYFVCCFSKVADELGQWRAYADDGRGYAIGFDAGVLEKAFEKVATLRSNLHSTFPVTYDDKELCNVHEQLVAETIPAISTPRGMNLGNEEISNFLQLLSVRLASSCFMASLFFKHEAYSNEQEYRFLQIFPANKPVPELKYRSRPYSLVRYREFDWKAVAANSVRELVLGPANDPNIGFKFANECLSEYLPDERGVSIRRSEIPYRSVRR